MFKKILSVFLGLGLAVFPVAASLFAPAPVSALEAGDIVMRITPAEQVIDLAPSQHFAGTIKVKNTGRLPFNFHLSTSPYQVLNENYDPDYTTENSYTKIHNWISFDQDQYHLEPGQEVEVTFRIDVPDDIPGGGQYAAIMVETHDVSNPDDTVKLSTRLAAIIFAHVSGEEHIGGVLLSHSLPGFRLGSPFSATATVKNDGNVDFRMTHTLEIRDFFTNKVVFEPEAITADGQTPGRATPIILPETSRSNTLTWEGAPQLGVFRATQKISFLDQEYTYEQVVVLCPIWLAGIFIFLIVLMILWLIASARKRRRNRPQVM